MAKFLKMRDAVMVCVVVSMRKSNFQQLQGSKSVSNVSREDGFGAANTSPVSHSDNIKCSLYRRQTYQDTQWNCMNAFVGLNTKESFPNLLGCPRRPVEFLRYVPKTRILHSTSGIGCNFPTQFRWGKFNGHRC